MDDLRTGIVRAAEQFTADLLVGRYHDPQVGFVVLVHPDREPTIVALTPATAQDIRNIQTRDQDESEDDRRRRREGPRFFTAEELHEAAGGLRQADQALRFSGFAWQEPEGRKFHLGRYIGDRIAEWWQRHRARPIEEALARAADEARRPAVCGNCGRRFTERGLTQHLRRSRWCSQDKHSAATDAQEAS